jgi:hypothetical protein
MHGKGTGFDRPGPVIGTAINQVKAQFPYE